MASCTEASVTSLFEATLKGVCPSRAQQRAIGEWTVQTHPVEHLLGALEILLLQKLGPEDKVRLVLDGQRKLIIAVDLTGTVKILAAFGLLSVLDEGDTEVVRGKAREALGVLEVRQNASGFWAPLMLSTASWALTG
jgi:hypothetical protein